MPSGPHTDQYLAEQFRTLMRRYGGATPEALVAILCPMLIPIRSLDTTIMRVRGQNHYRASFSVAIDRTNRGVIQVGRTGKFVPSAFLGGTGPWREIAKGRIIQIDPAAGVAEGEVYCGGRRDQLEECLRLLSPTDLWEVDQFGAAAKVLSALVEHSLVEIAEASGFTVRRMPEDMAQHLGSYANFDFEFEKNGVVKKVEAKSLWGTNTAFARLIHSTTTPPRGDAATWTEAQRRNYYPTSSCKFTTQDIFAVSLFLRTGNIREFAFARSVPRDVHPHGLPRATDFPDHVNQNPTCQIGDGTWFATLDEVWNLP